MNKKMRLLQITKNIIVALLLIVLLYGCANRGQGPQGGPKDEVPPRVVSSLPADKSINYTRNKIEINFDENITLKDIANNVIVSPPQRVNPDIRAYGRKLMLEFADTLKPDVTYSINFGNTIVDNNESNALKNYVFSFATGSQIDTMQLTGTLINAEDLNPLTGIIVGIHSDLNDSAFVKKSFDRITRTGDDGKFTVYNVKKDRFRVYALGDLNRDNMYQLGEGAALNEKVFETSMEDYMRQDTVWKDSLTVDTIRQVKAVRFLPNDVALRYFKDVKKKQYLLKSERPAQHKVSLLFNTVNEKLPEIKALNCEWENNYLLQRNATLDTLTYWLTDSTLIKKDTISLQLSYMKSDSAMNLVSKTDTIHFLMKKSARVQDTAKKTKKKEFLSINTNVSSKFDSYSPVNLSFTSPVSNLNAAAIHLNQVVDTVLVPRNFRVEKADSVGLNYRLHYKWEPESAYVLTMDSATVHDIYGLHNDAQKLEMKVRSLEDYSSLLLTMARFDSAAVFQVLDKNDKVIRTVPVQANPTRVEFLEPGDYYVRMFLDINRNKKWDTGDVAKNLQPEEVFYYSKKLTLIKNWEFEESWDHLAVPILLQKPTELKKDSKKQERD